MSSTIFGKVRTITLGNIHDLLDAIIDLNSMAAVRQNLRDLEEALDSIRDNLALAEGERKGLESEIVRLAGEMRQTDSDIDLLLSQGKDASATQLQVKLDGLKARQPKKEGELATAKTTEATLRQVVDQIETRHAAMLERVHELDQLERQTESQEHQTELLRNAAELSDSLDTSNSVDNVEARMRRDAAVAQSRFDRAVADVGADSTTVDVATARAQAAIAARKANLTTAGTK